MFFFKFSLWLCSAYRVGHFDPSSENEYLKFDKLAKVEFSWPFPFKGILLESVVALPGLMFESEKCPHVGMEAVVKFTYCLLSILHSQTYFYFKILLFF